LKDAPVGIRIFETPGHALIDSGSVRHVSEGIVIFMAEPAGGTDPRMHMGSIIDQCFVQSFKVFGIYALYYGIGHYGGGIVSYHAITVARTRPFGKKASLPESIGKPGLYLLVYGRIDKVKQREQGPESIPESSIGIHIAFTHLTVVRAVMYRSTRGIDFVKFAREQKGTVQAGIECTVLLLSAPSYADTGKDIAPTACRRIFHRPEIPVTELLKVQKGLIGRYE
jgi:hypothetical protein